MKAVTVSAPHRIEFGGFWDLKAFGLICQSLNPCTVNIAISARTQLTLRPYEADMVRISDRYHSEECNLCDADLNSHFGLVLAVAMHFDLSGINIEISYDVPPRSGLGGSGVLTICSVAAMAEYMEKRLDKPQILYLSHELENSMGFSITGSQDQAAAVYGGVNRWDWNYSCRNLMFRGIPLLSSQDQKKLSKRILIIYLGEPHNSPDRVTEAIESFTMPDKRAIWREILDQTKRLSNALVKLNWAKVVDLVQKEHDLSLRVLPARMTELAKPFAESMNGIKAAFTLPGAGGGCVCAICYSPDERERLRERWSLLAESISNARILDISVDSRGLIVEKKP